MDKCPYCEAETRPGDNFCLNCGNRLLPATPSPIAQQAQPTMGDATLEAPEGWGLAPEIGTAPSSGGNWGSNNAQTIASSGQEQAGFQHDLAPAAQATMDRIEQPGRLILRSDSGDVLQEYTLDKRETVIGRAPSSDILLSKDKLTSRRHATVRFENGHYMLLDEHSANGTFVNGQQIEEAIPRVLQDGDHIGIGEHELIFRTFASSSAGVEDMQTVVVPFDSGKAEPQPTWSTRADSEATVATNDDFRTQEVEENGAPPAPAVAEAITSQESAPPPAAAPSANVTSSSSSDVPSTPVATPDVPASSAPSVPSTPPVVEAPVATTVNPPLQESAEMTFSSHGEAEALSFKRFSSLSQPALPDLTSLIAALSALDGQVTALQQQFNATQDAMRTHEAEVIQTANELRTGIRNVTRQMDNTIADVARSRDTLAWADLLQLMEDVMNNPRDIEYVTKLARKARELNKVFQIHQKVLNTMAECNSLLRSLLGEDK
jgi:pSer/pThr/pTyr-binding forkhead associated (FHA) protein